MIEAKEYAKALFLLAEDEKNTDNVLESVKGIEKILIDNPEFVKLLDSPAVKNEERIKIIDSTFVGLETILLNFIKILCEKREIHSFVNCAKAFYEVYNESRNIEIATAITTKPLSDSQIKALTKKLEDMTGKTVIVNNEIDTSIIGGITLRFAGNQFDASIKARLDAFKEGLGKITV